MGSLAAIQLLVQENFSEGCQNHDGRPKLVLRFNSCDTVCTRCTYDEEPTIKFYIFEERTAVWLDDIRDFVDCSLIKAKYSEEGKMVIQLKANHPEDKCEVDNFCSLACKIENVSHQFGTLSSIDRLQNRVKKKRTGGRRKGKITIFFGFFMMMLIKRKARSGGRIRRAYGPVQGHLPPKKRNRRGDE